LCGTRRFTRNVTVAGCISRIEQCTAQPTAWIGNQSAINSQLPVLQTPRVSDRLSRDCARCGEDDLSAFFRRFCKVLTRQCGPVGKSNVERDPVVRSDRARDMPLASGVFSEQDVSWSQSDLSSSLELNLAFASQCHDELSA